MATIHADQWLCHESEFTPTLFITLHRLGSRASPKCTPSYSLSKGRNNQGNFDTSSLVLRVPNGLQSSFDLSIDNQVKLLDSGVTFAYRAEALPAAIQALRVISDPAIAEIAAIFRSLTLPGSLELPANKRSANGSGPDNTPPILVSHPVFPRRSGLKLGLLSISIRAPINDSPAAALIPNLFSAGASCPSNSRIDVVAAKPDNAKCAGKNEMLSCHTGTAVAPISTPVYVVSTAPERAAMMSAGF